MDWGGETYETERVAVAAHDAAPWRGRRRRHQRRRGSRAHDRYAARGAGSLLGFDEAERRLRAQVRRGSSIEFGKAWLTTEQLSDGVERAGRDDALACFVQKAAVRPVRVIALGGSVTAGLSFSVLTGDALERNHILYHRKLALWMRMQWPRTQSNTSVRNCGLPGAGPAFSALCFQSVVLAHRPDLVLLEYAVNVVEKVGRQVGR